MQTDKPILNALINASESLDVETIPAREKLAQFCDKTIVSASDNCPCGLPKSQHPAPTLTDAQRLAFMTEERDELRTNAIRLANYIERHHTLELDTEAALLVNEARSAIARAHNGRLAK